MDAPTRIDKYDLKFPPLGSGGFATVYRAEHHTLKNEVALKVLNQTGEANARERFLREAQTVAQLKHPQIVKIDNLFETADGLLCLSMDYYPEGDLKQWQQKHGAPALETTLSLLKDVAAALDYAHSQNLVHRDVKPSNILMDAKGRAYLSDFGLVYLANQERLTSFGAVVGTPEYFSPEQALGKYTDLDARSDQYSLAVVAYELLVGRAPFISEADSTTARAAIAVMHAKTPPPTPSALKTDLPIEFDAPFLKALAKAPAERFKNCMELAQALESAWENSRLRLYREALASVKPLMEKRDYEAAQAVIDQARQLLPEHPAWQAAQKEFETTRRDSEAYELCVKEWEAAQRDAQNVLTLDKNYSDPQGVFVRLGLRLPAARPLSERLREQLLTASVVLTLGGGGMLVCALAAFLWIRRP